MRRLKNRPSQTALLTAFYRTIANKYFPGQKFGSDYLAECFLPFHVRILLNNSKIRDKSKKNYQTRMPGVFEYVMARTAFFDDVFRTALSESIPQIIILGAGYDTRAYRFAAQNKCSRIFELDNAATQDRKKKCLNRVQLAVPDQLTYITMDFNRETLKDVLRNAGFENDQKTVFILEGVSMYLEPKSVDTILGFITHSSHEKSVFAFDYVITISDENSQYYHGAGEMLQLMKGTRSQESFKFSIDEDKTESFFDQRGLKIVKHWNHEQIEKSFLLTKDGTSPGKPNGVFRFVIASPD